MRITIKPLKTPVKPGKTPVKPGKKIIITKPPKPKDKRRVA